MLANVNAKIHPSSRFKATSRTVKIAPRISTMQWSATASRPKAAISRYKRSSHVSTLINVGVTNKAADTSSAPWCGAHGCIQARSTSPNAGRVSGLSMRKIAEELGRSPSTISREIGRNHGRQKYRATDAEERAWQQALRPKPCLLAANKSLRIVVAKKLADHWSLQQVSGWLKVEYLDDRTMRVSHETIYKSLFIQARGVLKKELISHLRSRRMNSRHKFWRVWRRGRAWLGRGRGVGCG